MICSSAIQQRCGPSPPLLWQLVDVVCGRVYVTVRRPSVRPSVRLSQLLTAAAACVGLAAVGPAGRRYRSRSSTARSSKREQCHVCSRRMEGSEHRLGNRVRATFTFLHVDLELLTNGRVEVRQAT